MGLPWTSENINTSGNLVLDLQNNFFLECGARTQYMRVYEMTNHPVARELIAFLLVRGTAHIVAFVKAIEMATGVSIYKMLPIPNLDHRVIEETKKYEDLGLGHTFLLGVKSVIIQISLKYGKGNILFRESN
ncbi:Mn-containing catalase OS=Ureibacillus acetophenoni OX=614649 GN=SAMN05877842_102316 PE=3 SV=1 [Ureibacillus acetophenoni]